MTPILLIAKNTIRQVVRQKIFYNVAVFGFGMVLFSMVVAQLTFGYPDRVVRSIGLSGVAVATDLLALLVSVGLIHGEIQQKTLFVVLTRPLSRWQYVVGRFVGMLATLCASLIGFGAVFFLTLVLAEGTPTVQDTVALLVILPEAAILAAFGLLMSSFSTPTVGGGIGLGFWVACTTTDDLVNLAKEADPITQGMARVIYTVLPSFARFDFREAAVYGDPIVAAHVVVALLYGALYAAFLVAVVSLVLSRREMT